MNKKIKNFNGKSIYNKAIDIIDKLDELQFGDKLIDYLHKKINLAMQNADDFVALERASSFMADRYGNVQCHNLRKFLIESKKEFDVGFLFQISIAEEKHKEYVLSKK